MMKKLLMVTMGALTLAGCASKGVRDGAGYDVNAADFARATGETDDTGRLQRAIDAASPYGVVYIPKGVWEVGSMLWVTNRASVLMHKSAILRATKEMDYVMALDLKAQWALLGQKGSDAVEDYNFFVRGGQIDGNGLASCLAVDNYRHLSLNGITFLNGKKYGLRVDGRGGHGYELVASDCYFKTVIHGCKGNEAVYSTGGDSHYLDCIVVDYTIGFHFGKCGWSNHLTRCHVWGGPVREMLDDSVNFLVEEDGCILTDCYADTGKVGFWLKANNTRLIGCFYYSNPCFKLDDIAMVRQDDGTALVSGCSFSKTAKNVKAYDHRGGKSEWRDCTYVGFDATDEKPGELFK